MEKRLDETRYHFEVVSAERDHLRGATTSLVLKPKSVGSDLAVLQAWVTKLESQSHASSVHPAQLADALREQDHCEVVLQSVGFQV